MEYDKQQKVRILEATYIPETDAVSWTVELPNGDRYPMSWPRKETSAVLGVKGEISVELLQEFHEKMVGKELNLIIKQAEKK